MRRYLFTFEIKLSYKILLTQMFILVIQEGGGGGYKNKSHNGKNKYYMNVGNVALVTIFNMTSVAAASAAHLAKPIQCPLALASSLG